MEEKDQIGNYTKKTGTYYLKVQIKGLPDGGNFRGNWRSKYKKTSDWKSKVHMAVRGKTPEQPLQQVRLKYTRFSSSKMDWDNLVISFKAVQDGLVESGIMKDDKVKNIPEMPIYAQEKTKKGEGYIEIEIWEINNSTS